MANAEVHGLNYVFGFKSADAPVITGFAVRKAELRFEPEVYAEAQDGEGHAEAIALSKSDSRMITATFTGYILGTLGTNPGGSNALPNFIDWTVNGTSRRFIFKSISEPHNKGEFVELTVEAVSKKLISPSSPIN